MTTDRTLNALWDALMLADYGEPTTVTDHEVGTQECCVTASQFAGGCLSIYELVDDDDWHEVAHGATPDDLIVEYLTRVIGDSGAIPAAVRRYDKEMR